MSVKAEKESTESSIDLRSLFVRFLANWYWFIIALALAIASGILYLRYADENFSIKSAILIKDEKKNGLSQESMIKQLEKVTDMPGSETSIDDEIQILKSANLMRRVVDSLKLYCTYYVTGRVKTSVEYERRGLNLTMLFSPDSIMRTVNMSIKPTYSDDFAILSALGKDSLRCKYSVPFKYAGQNFILQRQDSITENAEYKIKVRNPEIVAREVISTNLTIKKIEKSNALAISIKDGSPARGIDIINRLVQAYNQKILEDKNQAGRQTLNFIKDRLALIDDELKGVESGVEGLKSNKNLALEFPMQANNFVTRLNISDNQLVELDIRANILKNFKSHLLNDNNRYSLVPYSQEMSPAGSGVSDLIKQYNGLLLEREKRLKYSTTESPYVASLDKDLNALRQNLLTSIQTAQEDVETRRQKTKQEQSPLEKQVKSLPNSERQYIQIQRQQKIKEALFLFLSQKKEETDLSIAAQTNSAQFLEKPLLEGKIFPKKSQVLFLLGLLGLLIPAGLLTAIHFFDNKIRNSKDIQERTNTPFLGTIAFSKNDKTIVVSKNSRSAVSEMFRHLRTNIQFLNANKVNKVILVTSTLSGDGKTFIAINTGATFALSGKKTIVLGFDFRKPKLSSYINNKGTKDETGITNYLVGDMELKDLIQPTTAENLYYIDCGPLPPNPAEMMMSTKLREMISELKAQFDYLIIDSAPFALVTDSFLLKDVADSTIVVTRFKKTNFQLIEFIEETYSEQRLPNMGIVLNGAEAVRGYGYNYGYGYGYGYGYYDKGSSTKN